MALALSPLVLPIRFYSGLSNQSIQAATSIAFSQSAAVIQPLIVSTSIAFSETASIRSTTRTWAGTSLLPDILPGPAYGSFSKGTTSSVAGATSIAFTATAQHNRMFAATSVDWSASVDLNGTGSVVGATSIAFSESAALKGSMLGSTSIAFSVSAALKGSMLGTTSIAFSEAVDLNGTGALAAATPIAFSESVDLNGTGALVGAEAIAFSESVTLITDALIGTTSIAFSESVTSIAKGKAESAVSIAFSESGVIGGGSLWDISPLVLPISRYSLGGGFKQAALQDTASIDFTTSATLTGTGALGGDQIRFSTTVEIIGPLFLWLRGNGQLQGATSIAFSETANLISLIASESIAFSVSATLKADGALAGVTSVAFSDSASVKITGGIDAAESIAFSQTGGLRTTRAAQGAVAFDFTSTGDANAKGSLAAITSIAFSEAVGSTFNQAKGGLFGATDIRFENPGQLFRSVSGSETIAFSTSARLRRNELADDQFALFVKSTLDNNPYWIPTNISNRVYAGTLISNQFRDRTVITDSHSQKVSLDNFPIGIPTKVIDKVFDTTIITTRKMIGLDIK